MRRSAVTETDSDGVDVTNDVTVGKKFRFLTGLRSPHDLPNVVALDGLRGQAEVGDGVDQHEVLAEEPLHQAVQEGPAQFATGGHCADLDVPWRQNKVSWTTQWWPGNIINIPGPALFLGKISSKTSNN